MGSFYLIMPTLEELQREYNELLEEMANPEGITDWEGFGEKKKLLEEIVSKKNELEETNKRLRENEEVIKEGGDEDLVLMAKEENERLEKEKEEIIKELKRLIAEKEGRNESRNVKKGTAIIEIRAGAGGDESSLFAAELLEMYKRYLESKGVETKILDENKTEQGGLKAVTAKLKNKDPYSLMKYEGGVHRVQRVPETEKGGRIHTSTVSVAVLPEPKKGRVTVDPKDIRVQTCKASGPGGQYVNTRETAVRIFHDPTGIIVTSQNERSLQQNKETAMALLEAKLHEKEERERREKEEKERQSQIGSGMRAEKIRTYNFLQNRVTDHRIERSWYNLEEILKGELDEIISALREEEEREKYQDIVIEED